MPWAPGECGNPLGRAIELRHPDLARVRAIAKRASPNAIKRLIKLTKSSEPFVALGAIKLLLDRAWGKVPEASPDEPGGRQRRDLTAEQLQAIRDRAQQLLDAQAPGQPQLGAGMVPPADVPSPLGHGNREPSKLEPVE